MPKELANGKPTTRRYSDEEKAAAVRMVRTLRAELEILDRLPRPGPGRPADEFGLVVPVHRLSEGVVVAVAYGPDRGGRADLGEAFAVPNRRELATGIAVTAQVLVMSAS